MSAVLSDQGKASELENIKKEQAQADLERLSSRMNQVLRVLQALHQNPDPIKAAILLSELSGLQVQANNIMQATGISATGNIYADLMAIAGSETQKGSQPYRESNSMNSPYKYAGMEYASLEEMEAAQRMDKESSEKISKAEKQLKENHVDYSKLDKLQERIGLKDNKELESMDENAFREHHIQISALVAEREVLVENSKELLALQEEEILAMAHRRDLKAEDMQKLGEELALMERELKGHLPEHLLEIKKLADDWLENANNVAKQEEDLKKLHEYSEGLDKIRVDRHIEAPKAEEVQAAIEQHGIGYGLSSSLLEAAKVKVEEREAESERAAELRRKEEYSTKKEEEFSIKEEVSKEKSKTKIAVVNDETRSMCVDIGAEWGVKPSDMEGKSAQEILPLLEEKLRKDPALLDKNPDTAELFNFVKEEIGDSKSPEPAKQNASSQDIEVVSPVISLRFEQPSQSATEASQVRPRVHESIIAASRENAAEHQSHLAAKVNSAAMHR